jgi:hypothetical protein
MDNLTKSIIEHIRVFLILVLELTGGLFIKYILPFLIVIIVAALIIVRLHWKGLPIAVFMAASFLLMITGPLLLFKIITYETDLFIHLRDLSLSVAVQTTIVLVVIFHKSLFK